MGPNNILGKFSFSRQEAIDKGEMITQRLAALLSTHASGAELQRSLELDGFSVSQHQLELVPMEGPVSEKEEEDRFVSLTQETGLPSVKKILKHLEDARDHYQNGKYHSCIGESRTFFQAVVDDISTETDSNGNHSVGLSGNTKGRIGYLKSVGFFSDDECAAFLSAWGFLSAGNHPGIPQKAEARIGLILALEFGQLYAIEVC